jgi:hypothetical protein
MAALDSVGTRSNCSLVWKQDVGKTCRTSIFQIFITLHTLRRRKVPDQYADTRETVDNPILPKILSCLPCAWTPVKNYDPNNVEQHFHIGCVLDAAVFGQEAGTD